MKRILTAAVLAVLVLYVVYWAPRPIFLGGILLFMLVALWEYCRLASLFGQRLSEPVIYLGGLSVVLVAYLRPHLTPPVMGMAFLILFTFELARRQKLAELVPAVALGFTGWFYVALPFAFLVMLRDATMYGSRLILFLIFVIAVGDTAAYYTGRAIGRRKLAPEISPGKTVEGTVASLIFATAAGGWLLWKWFPPLPQYHLVLLPFLLNVAGQVGDLAESALKRGAGRKDSSSLLPGHGGLLDRIDGLLFGAPLLWYYFILVLRAYF